MTPSHLAILATTVALMFGAIAYLATWPGALMLCAALVLATTGLMKSAARTIINKETTHGRYCKIPDPRAFEKHDRS